MANTSDIRKGLCIRYNNDIYKIVDFMNENGISAIKSEEKRETKIEVDDVADINVQSVSTSSATPLFKSFNEEDGEEEVLNIEADDVSKRIRQETIVLPPTSASKNASEEDIKVDIGTKADDYVKYQ